MNILFLTLVDFPSFSHPNLYCDLLREFISHGHEVYAISPSERRYGIPTHLEENGHLLKLKIGNTQKTNLLEKGISTLRIEPQYIGAVKRFFSHVRFDLVLYSTPPITFCRVVEYVRKRDGAKTYLMLKDIFPQNAVDLGMMSKTGVKSVLYRYFRRKEEKLYRISDEIGCMSQANVDYLLKNNPTLSPAHVTVCPNGIQVRQIENDEKTRQSVRQAYGLPTDKQIFVYGGNLGKPQDIDFVIRCLQAQKDCTDRFYFIVGSGTEYGKLEAYVKDSNATHVKLLPSMPKETFDRLLAACDVGLIFLDHRFTIPNYPSRLLSYLQAKLPVVVCTDPNTDMGTVAEENGFGWKCCSDSVQDFCRAADSAVNRIGTEGENGYRYLCSHDTAERDYQIIMGRNQ